MIRIINKEAPSTSTRPPQVPTVPGLYYARTPDFLWCNLLVLIEGKAPFLSHRVWDLSDNTASRELLGEPSSEIWFGERLPDPKKIE